MSQEEADYCIQGYEEFCNRTLIIYSQSPPERKKGQSKILGQGAWTFVLRKEVTNGKFYRSETICSGKLYCFLPLKLCKILYSVSISDGQNATLLRDKSKVT